MATTIRDYLLEDARKQTVNSIGEFRHWVDTPPPGIERPESRELLDAQLNSSLESNWINIPEEIASTSSPLPTSSLSSLAQAILSPPQTTSMSIPFGSVEIETADSLWNQPEFRNTLLIVAYSLIVIISLFGNLVVLKIMLSRNTPQTATNLLIVNLAVSDLLLTTFNIPVNVTRFVSRDWPFGPVVCLLTPFLQSVSAHCSAITMMVIALERYNRIIGGTLWRPIKNAFMRFCCCCSRRENESHAMEIADSRQGSVRYHTKHRLSTSPQTRAQSLQLILFIWLSTALLAAPHALNHRVMTLSPIPQIKLMRCRNVQPEPLRTILAVIAPLTQYLLPMGITTGLYLRIGHFLWMRRDPVGSVSENRRETLLRRRRNRIKMLALVCGVFAFCWLPLHVFVTLREFGIVQHHFGIFFVTHSLAMSSACYNPFIYCWLNENFRNKTNMITSVARFVGSCLAGLCCRAEKTSLKPASSVVNSRRSNSCASSVQIPSFPRGSDRRKSNALSTPEESNVDNRSVTFAAETTETVVVLTDSITQSNSSVCTKTTLLPMTGLPIATSPTKTSQVSNGGRPSVASTTSQSLSPIQSVSSSPSSMPTQNIAQSGANID